MRFFVLLLFLSLPFWTGMSCTPPTPVSEGETGNETVLADEPSRPEPTDASPQEEPSSDTQPDEVISEPHPDEVPELDGGFEPSPDVIPEPDQTPDDPKPQPCASGTACNQRLTANGSCPGQCILQKRGMVCRGQVLHGLCYDAKLTTSPKSYQFRNGLKLVFSSLPSKAIIQKEITIVGEFSNPTNQSISVKLRAQARLPAWTLSKVSFSNPGTVSIAAGGTLPLSMTLKASMATVFDPRSWSAVTLSVDNSQVSLSIPVGFPVGSGVSCGGHSFPKKWCKWSNCKGQGDSYTKAKCCNGVFYPSATCCDDSDCGKGSCYDGLCVSLVPNNGFALSPLVGTQRILVVAADQRITPPTGGVCTKADKALEQKLNLDKVAKWYETLALQRTGRPLFKIQWHTLVIPDSKVFAPGDAKVEPNAMLAKLEQWLKQKGCINGFDTDFDKVLLITPRVLIPSTGRAVALGRAVAVSYSPHSLLAHELGHLYGARDLYLNSGGKLQWRAALMSSADVSGGVHQGVWTDAVFWGEVGLGDVNRNGVIDVAEWPVDPVELQTGKVAVTKLSTGTVPYMEVQVPIVAKEPTGTLVPFRLPTLKVTLPEYGLFAATLIGGVATFRGGKFDPAPIQKAGKVKVRLEVTWTYTRSNGARKTLKLDKTLELKVP